MQQPTRYYITKSGDEPTVRSVKVALGVKADDDRGEARATNPLAESATPQEDLANINGLKRIVQDAIRKNVRPA